MVQLRQASLRIKFEIASGSTRASGTSRKVLLRLGSVNRAPKPPAVSNGGTGTAAGSSPDAVTITHWLPPFPRAMAQSSSCPFFQQAPVSFGDLVSEDLSNLATDGFRDGRNHRVSKLFVSLSVRDNDRQVVRKAHQSAGLARRQAPRIFLRAVRVSLKHQN